MGTEFQATPGMYKFSVFAGFYDVATGNVPGSAGNGWKRAIADYGTGTPKQLKGALHVYQVLDFTNMKAETLTLTSPTGVSTAFKNMASCSDLQKGPCTPYKVKTISLSDGGNITVDYDFPLTYNGGNWSEASGGKINTSPSGTSTVTINCVKPAISILTSLMGKTTAEAKKMKIVLVRYEFDVTGLSAETKKGNFMVYDPTVKSSGTAASDAVPKAFPVLAAALAVLMTIRASRSWP